MNNNTPIPFDPFAPGSAHFQVLAQSSVLSPDGLPQWGVVGVARTFDDAMEAVKQMGLPFYAIIACTPLRVVQKSGVLKGAISPLKLKEGK